MPKTPVSRLKELLLLDVEKTYSILNKAGYNKSPPCQFKTGSECLFQKKHTLDCGERIFYTIHSYPPFAHSTEYSFEVEMSFETLSGHWARVLVYTYTASVLVSSLDQIESKLKSVFLVLKK